MLEMMFNYINEETVWALVLKTSLSERREENGITIDQDVESEGGGSPVCLCWVSYWS